MAPLVLYHFAPSAPSRSALLAIRNLNLDVSIKKVDLFAKEQLSAEFIKINPQHTIPTIDDDGFVLWESRAIGSYLVDAKAPGNSLYPADPKKRAIINQRLYFDASVLYIRIRAICFPVLFLGETKVSEENRKNLYDAFEFLNKFLDGNKWFIAGDSPSLADLAILASLSSIIHVGASLSNYPNLSRWYDECKSLPGFEENDAGAKQFGDKVRGNLKEQL